MKPGRNDPCTCGSGQKYKKCCLTKDEAARVAETARLQRQAAELAAQKAAEAETVASADKAGTPDTVGTHDKVGTPDTVGRGKAGIEASGSHKNVAAKPADPTAARRPVAATGGGRPKAPTARNAASMVRRKAV